MTWGRWYWPLWMIVPGLAMLLIPEIYALFTNVHNTLSYWVWQRIGVSIDGPPAAWSWAHFLLFGVWCTFGAWLTFHFFWGWFR